MRLLNINEQGSNKRKHTKHIRTFREDLLNNASNKCKGTTFNYDEEIFTICITTGKPLKLILGLIKNKIYRQICCRCSLERTNVSLILEIRIVYTYII